MIIDTDFLVAVDFDGTITEKDNFPSTHFDINPQAVEYLKRIKELGVTLILFTCREGELLVEALKVCREHGLRFDYINTGNGKRGDSRKINADFYIDDRAYFGKIDWGRVYRYIAKLKEERG